MGKIVFVARGWHTGLIIIELAGGDYDGDDVAVVFNAKLAAFVKATKPALDHLPVAAAEGAVKAAIGRGSAVCQTRLLQCDCQPNNLR